MTVNFVVELLLVEFAQLNNDLSWELLTKAILGS
jgi:hypothetical protein